MKRDRYYSEKELRSIAADLTSAEAIPVNVEIEAEHRVLDLSEVEKILKHSENIFLARLWMPFTVPQLRRPPRHMPR